MKRFNLIPIILMQLILSLLELNGQEEDLKYGKTPDEMFPYDKFQKAYIYHFVKPTQFYGAGREKLPPADLTEVRLGLLAPLEGSIMTPQGIQMLQGTTLAIEEANKKGGYKGLPFKLMAHNDVGLWGAAANEIVKMDDEGVWAWVGSLDDINSHVAIRVTLKLEIPMMSPADPDPTFTETNIPWVFRNISDDRQSSYALVNYIYKKEGHKRIAVIRANNRYGRVGIMEFRDAAQRIGFPIVIEVRFNDGETNFISQLESIKKTKADAIVIWGNDKESALILKQIRKMGMKQPVFGSDRMVSPIFFKIAGSYAENIVTTCQYNPEANDPKLKAFQTNYKKRFGIEPDVFAAHSYDAMNLFIEAIYKVGLNRALIRDVLSDFKTFQGYKGVTGEIIFDASLNDIGEIFYAEVKNGKFIFYPTSDIIK